MTTWKVGETCIHRGIYGTVSPLMDQSAQVEFGDYRQVTVPLAELTRLPRLTQYRPTGRWDSGNRLAPTPRQPNSGAVRGSQDEQSDPKG